MTFLHRRVIFLCSLIGYISAQLPQLSILIKKEIILCKFVHSVLNLLKRNHNVKIP
jgi:hypothetical protein